MNKRVKSITVDDVWAVLCSIEELEYLVDRLSHNDGLQKKRES